jgi:peptidoglycan hydrolase CwlO-like protein
MKKILAICLIISLALVMFGCTTTEVNDTNTTVTTENEANQSIDDLSSDLTGLEDTINDIDNLLGEE